jgi:hypothetical protein
VNRVIAQRIAPVSLILMVLHAWSAARAYAQASVPNHGEGTLTLTYENYEVVGHFDIQGRTNENGGTRSHALVAEFDYGLLQNVGLLVSLPFIASKYTGPPSYFVGPFLTDPGPLDDGSYHAAFQDVRIELRRQWWARRVPLTPFVGGSFPTHEYETVGEAVPGRRRWDLQAGASAGVDLDHLLPGSYAHVRYAFGRMEEVNNFPFTRSNIDLEVGTAATPRLVIRGIASWQIKHSGPSLAQLAPDWVNHDRFIAPSYLNLGGGPSLSLTQSTDLFALLVATATGSNGAHRERTIAVGVSVALNSGLHGLGGANPSRRAAIGPASRIIEKSQ